jgi:RimJ/RimL family protein N-acetyltransferase
MRRIPILNTQRLTIRPFTEDDIAPMHRISDLCFGDGTQADDAAAIEAGRRMHTWRVLNEEMLAQLYQPPYGDRAIALKQTGELIGAVGLVPYIDAFNVVPALRHFAGATNDDGSRPRATAEVGLFWCIDPAHQRKGYAAEAAQAMIDYAFNELHLVRIIATTDFDNLASQAVMRKVGMTLHHNESGNSPWMEVVGVLERP